MAHCGWCGDPSSGGSPFPKWFFETNTAVTLGFVLGGAWLESLQLRDGGAHVARMVGGREVAPPQSAAERRLRNIVDEMAIASGLKAPRVFVLDGEDSINALAAGWDQQDSVIAVTRGALERLNAGRTAGRRRTRIRAHPERRYALEHAPDRDGVRLAGDVHVRPQPDEHRATVAPRPACCRRLPCWSWAALAGWRAVC